MTGYSNSLKVRDRRRGEKADTVQIEEKDLIAIKNYRGKGIGARLARRVEEQLEGKEFNNINLCTNEFQAPLLYEKYGFKFEYIRGNAENPKLNKYFYVKYINKYKGKYKR